MNNYLTAVNFISLGNALRLVNDFMPSSVTLHLKAAKKCHCERSDPSWYAAASLPVQSGTDRHGGRSLPKDCFPAERGISLLAMQYKGPTSQRVSD